MVKQRPAVVQNGELGEADIEKFQHGLYTIAINGETWGRNFVNAWTPVFNQDGARLAATVRLNLYEYTICRGRNAVVPDVQCRLGAPVQSRHRLRARSGSTGRSLGTGQRTALCYGRPDTLRLWQQKISPDGKNIAAIAAVKFGKFTVTVNDKAWTNVFAVVTDLVQSPDGKRAAAIGQEGGKWSVVVDDSRWSGRYDRAWGPVFSPDGRHVARQGGKE